LGILAVNLDLPLCVFLLDASETNYSGFRGAIDQARQRPATRRRHRQEQVQVRLPTGPGSRTRTCQRW